MVDFLDSTDRFTDHMQFWESTEVFGEAFDAVVLCGRSFNQHLNKKFKESILAEFDAEFRFVPIVMPIDMHKKYTERSKLQRKLRIIDCAPHLDFETFVSGTFKDQLTEYVRGIATCVHMLAKLGATSEQVAAFEHLLSEAVDSIFQERLDQTRH